MKPAKVTCENVRAANVIVAGAVKGNITAQKVEIRSSGRVWGDIITTAFATEEGAFLRGQIRMEDAVDLGLDALPQNSPVDPGTNTTCQSVNSLEQKKTLQDRNVKPRPDRCRASGCA